METKQTKRKIICDSNEADIIWIRTGIPNIACPNSSYIPHKTEVKVDKTIKILSSPEFTSEIIKEFDSNINRGTLKVVLLSTDSLTFECVGTDDWTWKYKLIEHTKEVNYNEKTKT